MGILRRCMVRSRKTTSGSLYNVNNRDATRPDEGTANREVMGPLNMAVETSFAINIK